jgi:hypothetical protein
MRLSTCDRAGGGLVSYMAIEREMGTVEIGHVTWSRR